MMRKWNCNTGLLVGEPWKGKGEVYALVLSPDGKTIGVMEAFSNGTQTERLSDESRPDMVTLVVTR